jgi:hypothetical protein
MSDPEAQSLATVGPILQPAFDDRKRKNQDGPSIDWPTEELASHPAIEASHAIESRHNQAILSDPKGRFSRSAIARLRDPMRDSLERRPAVPCRRQAQSSNVH